MIMSVVMAAESIRRCYSSCAFIYLQYIDYLLIVLKPFHFKCSTVVDHQLWPLLPTHTHRQWTRPISSSKLPSPNSLLCPIPQPKQAFLGIHRPLEPGRVTLDLHSSLLFQGLQSHPRQCSRPPAVASLSSTSTSIHLKL